MGLFLSFLGGAAEQFTETLKESEKTAKAEAALRTKALYENYAEVVKSNRKLESDLKADVAFLQGLNPNISQEQVSALVFNRPVMDMIKKKIEAGEVNPKELDFATLTGITEQNANPITATQRIESMFKIPKATAAVETAMPKGFFEGVSARQQKAAEAQMSAALGVSMEELRGARGFVPTAPKVDGQINLEQLMKKPDFKNIKDNAQVALVNALNTGDEEKIKAATENVARIVSVEEQSQNKDKTEPQIQSELISKIQAATDPKEKQLLTNQLRQRQVLAKLPGEGKSDADKISQSNLIVTATKMRDAVLTDMLPPGSFVTVIDPNTGASTLNIKELKQPELYKQGVEAGRSAIIKEFTNPQTGMPRSEMHKNAMMSVGIQFDQTGRPVGGTMTPTPEPAAGMPAPKTKAEYDAILSGTQYRDTDGKVKIKR